MPRRAGLTPARVAAAAAEIADRDGLGAVTLTRIARSLRVEPPSLYEHVAGLGAIRLGLRLRGLNEMTDRSRRAAVGRSDDEAVRALAVAMRTFARSHPGLYEATVRAAEEDRPEAMAAAAELLQVYLSVLEGYGLRGAEAIHALRYVRSALHGFVSLEAGGGFGRPERIDASFDRLVRAVTFSLRCWGAERFPSAA